MADFIETTVDDGRRALALVGEVDIASTQDLIDAGRRCLGEADAVELDLDRLTFIDSSGLGALVLLRNEANAQGKALRLANVPPSTHRLLRITGLDRTFDFDPQQQ